ncbi:hypothetical protein ACOSQ2_007195 [Xanthoceras sorbifolium]
MRSLNNLSGYRAINVCNDDVSKKSHCMVLQQVSAPIQVSRTSEVQGVSVLGGGSRAFRVAIDKNNRALLEDYSAGGESLLKCLVRDQRVPKGWEKGGSIRHERACRLTSTKLDCSAEDLECGRIVDDLWLDFGNNLQGMVAVQNCLATCASWLDNWNAHKWAGLRRHINEKKDMLYNMTSASCIES